MVAVPEAKSDSKDAVTAFTEEMRKAGYITSNDHLMQILWRMTILAGATKGLEAVVLQGPPGCGKTYAGECLARLLNATMVGIQFTTGVGREAVMDDIHLANILTMQAGMWDKKSMGEFTPALTLQAGILVQAMEESQKGKTVLLLDEMDKAKHQVDAMLLEFLNNGKVYLPARGNVHANPENLLVVMTMNNERQLSEPLMRRCRAIVLGWPDQELEWRLVRRHTRIFAQDFPKLLGGKYKDGAPEGLCKALVTLANKIRKEELTASLKKVPSTPELMRAAVDMMVTPDKRRRGKIASDWFFKYEDDRAALLEAKKFTESDEALAAIFAGFE